MLSTFSTKRNSYATYLKNHVNARMTHQRELAIPKKYMSRNTIVQGAGPVVSYRTISCVPYWSVTVSQAIAL